MGVCACIGPQGADPVCPCRMKTGHYCQGWARFPAMEGDLKLVTKPENGSNYLIPIILIQKVKS